MLPMEPKNYSTVLVLLATMTLNRDQILNCVRLPARLDVQATADVLNFAVHDIPVLVRAKLLEPLGSPAANAPKYFARKTVLEYADDPEWLSRATKALSAYWRKKRSQCEARSAGAVVLETRKDKKRHPQIQAPNPCS